MQCTWCSKKFSKKSNLQRHITNQHDNKSIHHHGLQYVDKKFIKRDTYCFLHQGVIMVVKYFIAMHVISVFVLTVWKNYVTYVIKIFVIIRKYQ